MPVSHQRARRPLVLLALLGLTSCRLILGPDDLGEKQRDLDRNRRRWESLGIVSYDYTLRRSCFCATEAIGPVRISVRNGVVTARVYVDTGQPVASVFWDIFPAIDGVFDIVQKAIDREAADLRTSYDSGMYFPNEIVIDYVRNAVDDELTVTATGFALR
jgi:hypothetical protein